MEERTVNFLVFNLPIKKVNSMFRRREGKEAKKRKKKVGPVSVILISQAKRTG